MDVVIVDFGTGNINSIKRSFLQLDVNVIHSSDKTVIENADALVMPGVGHFEVAMNFLTVNHIDSVLNFAVHEKKTPVLGICLGMQLMTNYSEEGEVNGLGWINAITKKIIPKRNEIYKVPNIGWCLVNKGVSSKLLKGIDCDRAPFYFCHSYAVKDVDKGSVSTSSFNYDDEYVSIFEFNNIYGVQFHPEKSHAAGINLLSNSKIETYSSS
jgi:glutamine amidotransferase